MALGNKYTVKDTRARGQGAYGTILLVEDRAFRLFAAKVETVSTSLMNEISLLQKLQHPGILPVLECHVAPCGLSYFIMPYIPSSLFSFLHSSGSLDHDAQKGLFQQLMNSMAYIHKMKVIHGDVKPGNIMYDQSRQHFYLIDFGLAFQLPVPEGLRHDSQLELRSFLCSFCFEVQ